MIPGPSRELRVFCLLLSGFSMFLFASAGAWSWSAVFVCLFVFWMINLYGLPKFGKSDSDAV